MADLYDALGVDRKADRAEIRKAYRRKSKKTHPDAGGSVESFAIISLAHDVLTDEWRRKRYDETGAAESAKVDNSLGEAIQAAVSAMDEALTVCANCGIDPLTIDLVADTMKTLEIKIEASKNLEAKLKEVLALNRKIRDRLSVKSGTNFLGASLDQKIAELERRLEAAKAEREKLKRAMAIVKAHKFDWTRAEYSDRNRMTLHIGPLMAAAVNGL